MALLALVALAAVGGCHRQAATSAPPPAKVTINDQAWTVELAITDQQQQRGLSGRASIDPDKGMLFMYSQPQVMEFWMKGCLMPIDIAFISGDMKVVRIYTMSCEGIGTPESQYRRYSSLAPAQYALEVGAGQLEKARVKVGDQVYFSNVPGNAP